MAKLKTEGEYRFGKVYVYEPCELSFDENGIAEVKDELVQSLLAVDARLSLLEEKSTASDLLKMNVKDLKELALEIEGIDKAKVETLKKQELIDLISSNITE